MIIREKKITKPFEKKRLIEVNKHKLSLFDAICPEIIRTPVDIRDFGLVTVALERGRDHCVRIGVGDHVHLLPEAFVLDSLHLARQRGLDSNVLKESRLVSNLNFCKVLFAMSLIEYKLRLYNQLELKII